MSERLIDADALAKTFEALKRGANLRDTVYLDGVLAVIDNAPTIEPKRGEWINIKHDTPHDESTVLVTDGSDIHFACFINCDVWSILDDHARFGAWEITHWMPLPEPPDMRKE